MEFGRVIRVRFLDGKSALYVVGEQDLAKAGTLVATQVPANSELEHVGHASAKLLLAMSIAPGEIKRTDE